MLKKKTKQLPLHLLQQILNNYDKAVSTDQDWIKSSS